MGKLQLWELLRVLVGMLRTKLTQQLQSTQMTRAAFDTGQRILVSNGVSDHVATAVARLRVVVG